MTGRIQFMPFSSALDVGFWHKLSQLKLDVYGLDDQHKYISGFYVNSDPGGTQVCRMNIDYTAFYEEAKTPPRSFPTHGLLKNFNTLDEFKSCDKQAFLQQSCAQLWKNITSGTAIKDPSQLVPFLLLTFADLKKYDYIYWFAFPALLAPEYSELKSPPKPLAEYFTPEQVISLVEGYDRLCVQRQLGFFTVITEGSRCRVGELGDVRREVEAGNTVTLAVCEPSTVTAHPGWPCRNLITLASYHWADILSSVHLLCFRDRFRDGLRDFNSSVVFEVSIQNIKHLTECPKGVGWEKNAKGQLGPRKTNLSASMDPIKLAESAVDLNLKLMRWRLLPELNLQKISELRCLLLGAGTLGCNVGRCLLGWGVRNITLVDNSRISYSNPVRQSLFVFEDSLHGGLPKAETAAEALKKIFPGVNAVGLSMSIPMPGHPISEGAIKQTREDVEKLERLVEDHDVIFMLMDTRESRWLPTILGAVKSKLVINAALGFDTFLVVRHGVRDPASTCTLESLPLKAPIPGSLLGCYFCNDVVAPGDSTRDRTLDQQCTVSRPGMSMITAALAVELLVSVLQHPLGTNAPADTSARDEHLTKDHDSPLGLVPHQIRGFLSRFHQVMPASRAYDKCTACSQTVCEKYLSDGFDFLLNVFNEPSYLEDLTGLTALHAETHSAEILELSDDEDFET